MALDLNKPVDEGDEQALPDLNEEMAEVDIHVGQEEDQLGVNNGDSMADAHNDNKSKDITARYRRSCLDTNQMGPGEKG
uniref:Uncharacterized protein n=1 Tax=Oryza rufipogon TaxID=4529 RepID=A0A0E0RF59_ORYRU